MEAFLDVLRVKYRECPKNQRKYPDDKCNQHKYLIPEPPEEIDKKPPGADVDSSEDCNMSDVASDLQDMLRFDAALDCPPSPRYAGDFYSDHDSFDEDFVESPPVKEDTLVNTKSSCDSTQDLGGHKAEHVVPKRALEDAENNLVQVKKARKGDCRQGGW